MLSIIIPVYNAENIMDKCVESLVNQKTKYNYEKLQAEYYYSQLHN